MFRCKVTNRLSDPGAKCNKIVVATRPRTYRHYNHETEESWETHGTEIVREINATDVGVELWNKMTPEQQELFVKRLK